MLGTEVQEHEANIRRDCQEGQQTGGSSIGGGGFGLGVSFPAKCRQRLGFKFLWDWGSGIGNSGTVIRMEEGGWTKETPCHILVRSALLLSFVKLGLFVKISFISMTVNNLKFLFMAIGSFGYFKGCYLSYKSLKIVVESRQSGEIGHNAITVFGPGGKFVHSNLFLGRIEGGIEIFSCIKHQSQALWAAGLYGLQPSSLLLLTEHLGSRPFSCALWQSGWKVRKWCNNCSSFSHGCFLSTSPLNTTVPLRKLSIDHFHTWIQCYLGTIYHRTSFPLPQPTEPCSCLNSRLQDSSSWLSFPSFLQTWNLSILEKPLTC